MANSGNDTQGSEHEETECIRKLITYTQDFLSVLHSSIHTDVKMSLKLNIQSVNLKGN
jgi:hypothetical protein